MKQFFLSALFLLPAAGLLRAQSISINTDGSSADTSAILDVKSTDKGILIPRMDAAQRMAISMPATGLLVFDPGDVASSTRDAGCPGLAANWRRARPYTALLPQLPRRLRPRYQDTTGISGGHNTFVGELAGDQNMYTQTPATGNDNTALGYTALKKNTAGGSNTAIGSRALSDNIIGGYNTAVGADALTRNTGESNTAVGANVLRSNTSGSKNTAIGTEALGTYNDIGAENTTIGYQALQGKNNIANSGTSNTAVGHQALADNETGSANTAIGTGAQVTTSNSRILGGPNVRVGIGLSGNLVGPANALEISAPGGSGLTFRNLNAAGPVTNNPPSTNVLSVDANGEVILVPCCSAGGGVAGPCPAPTLTADAGTNLNGHNFYFEDGPTGINQNNVGIGLACGASITAKLHVRSNQNVSGNNTGIFSDVFNNGASNTGVYGAGQGGNAVENIGVRGLASGSNSNYGVYGLSPNLMASGSNFGVFGLAQSAPTNYGGYRGECHDDQLGSLFQWKHLLHRHLPAF